MLIILGSFSSIIFPTYSSISPTGCIWRSRKDRNCSKSQSLGESSEFFYIFPTYSFISPTDCIWRSRRDRNRSKSLGESSEFFYILLHIFCLFLHFTNRLHLKKQKRSKLFQFPEPRGKLGIFLHIFHIFLPISHIFLPTFHIFLHILTYSFIFGTSKHFGPSAEGGGRSVTRTEFLVQLL